MPSLAAHEVKEVNIFIVEEEASYQDILSKALIGLASEVIGTDSSIVLSQYNSTYKKDHTPLDKETFSIEGDNMRVTFQYATSLGSLAEVMTSVESSDEIVGSLAFLDGSLYGASDLKEGLEAFGGLVLSSSDKVKPILTVGVSGNNFTFNDIRQVVSNTQFFDQASLTTSSSPDYTDTRRPVFLNLNKRNVVKIRETQSGIDSPVRSMIRQAIESAFARAA